MTDKSQIIHEKAMEYSHKGDFALAKGQSKEHALGFYKKAYLLEKQAIELFDRQKSERWFFKLHRSAAALAYHANLLKEAEQMIEETKDLNPPAWLIEELNEIQNLVNEKRKNNQESSVKITGELFKVDTKDHEIFIEDKEENIYDVFVPTSDVKSIVKNFISEQVLINARKNSTGLIILENIRAAA